MSSSGIKIVKTARECILNNSLKAGGAKSGFLYDYHVFKDGELAAIFMKTSLNQGRKNYALADMSGSTIKAVLKHRGVHSNISMYAAAKHEFEAVFLKALECGHIPTKEEVESRAAKKLADRKEAERLRLEEDKRYQIRNAAPELYTAAKAVLSAEPSGLLICMHELAKAVAKAELPYQGEEA